MGFCGEMPCLYFDTAKAIPRFSLPAPFDVIYASFTPRAASGVQQQQTYDSREGKSLLDWVRSIARIVTTPDGLP